LVEFLGLPWVYYPKKSISWHSSMSLLADAPDLVGFFSYSREDDEGSGGKLSKLRARIQEELRAQLGRTKRDFRLWQDKSAIQHGELWGESIKSALMSRHSSFRSLRLLPSGVPTSNLNLSHF
jgi:hypothetical protein